MSVHRIMGLETEYGIAVPGHPHVNAMITSSQIVNAYGRSLRHESGHRTRWNYAEESPLRDARGYDMSRADADPSLLTDDDDLGLANVILPNGARLYVDHAHPEYSTPEVTNPKDAVLWDRAGLAIMQQAMAYAAQDPSAFPMQLYKNNTDNKGASYGCHENYLMRRETPFADIVRILTPFFLSRQIVVGAGRVGLGQMGQTAGFQISQRADYFETEVGLETTLKRPIINTRDEPHADPELHRRLHVIIGDANLSEVSTYLKMGITAIVLAMIEQEWFGSDVPIPKDPVRDLHAVSHDPTLQAKVELLDGSSWTALDLQYWFHEQAMKFCARTSDNDIDVQTQDVLNRWIEVLGYLETDPSRAAHLVDWVAKLNLLEAYRDREDLSWDSAKLELIDLQYSDVRSQRGLAFILERRGQLERLTTDADVAHAVANPPTDTRAYFRGTCISRFPDHIAAASWDSLVFDIPGQASLIRVPTLDPHRGTYAHTSHLFTQSPTAQALLDKLGG
jgi:proteasome accessory factor PafA2